MDNPILEISGISKSFHLGGRALHAVRDVSLAVGACEAVGLVGESGCGKSTLARLVTRLETPDAGRILLYGEDITHISGRSLYRAYSNMKMIFQDARSSFDPRLSIGASICETLRVRHKLPKRDLKDETVRLLTEVGLDESYARAHPQDISGGECQRAAIARAIATNPRLLICDEATSALDVSVQAQVLELLRDLGQKKQMSFLFISHDLALVSSFCSRTYVMYNGEIAEHGDTAQIINNPQNEYTRRLISSVLT